MALLAESLVEEWLNRAGYFTIRGLKHGVDEIIQFIAKGRSFRKNGVYKRAILAIFTKIIRQEVRSHSLRVGIFAFVPKDRRTGLYANIWQLRKTADKRLGHSVREIFSVGIAAGIDEGHYGDRLDGGVVLSCEIEVAGNGYAYNCQSNQREYKSEPFRFVQLARCA